MVNPSQNLRLRQRTNGPGVRKGIWKTAYKTAFQTHSTPRPPTGSMTSVFQTQVMFSGDEAAAEKAGPVAPPPTVCDCGCLCHSSNFDFPFSAPLPFLRFWVFDPAARDSVSKVQSFTRPVSCRRQVKLLYHYFFPYCKRAAGTLSVKLRKNYIHSTAA